MSRSGLPKVVVTHWVHDEVAAYLAEFAEPLVAPAEVGVWNRNEVLRRSADAAAVIACMADNVDREFLEHCPDLSIVAATLKGFDNFDVAACTARGVWLTIVPDDIIGPTAELGVALALGLGRQVRAGDELVRRGYAGWRPVLYGSSLTGATVGIVGMGELGRAVAGLLTGFGCRIVYADPAPMDDAAARRVAAERVELDALAGLSDLVFVTAPLVAATYRLIDAAFLARLATHALLINIGRGSVVDEDAVADALTTGRLAGYAADVFAMEDWARSDRPPAIPARLLDDPRTLFTPHLGSAVDAVRRRMSLTAARQVRQALTGATPDHAVNDVADRQRARVSP